MSKEIQQVEVHVDGTLERLPLFGVPRYQAISAILANLEFALFQTDRSFGRRSPAAYMSVLNYKPAAALLALKAWQKCPVSDNPLPTDTGDPLPLAYEASLFAANYSVLCDVFPAFHRNELIASRHDRLVVFQYTSAKARIHDALSFLGQVYKARYPPEQREDPGRILTLQGELDRSVRNDVKTDSAIPTFMMSEATLAKGLQLAEAETRPASLPEQLACGGYDIATFKNVSVALRMISNIGYALWERLRIPAMGTSAFWGPVIWYSAEDLVALVCRVSQLHEDAVRAILHDLTFNPHDSRPDLEVNPLVLYEEQLWLAPHIVQTYRWEDNLMRLWSIKYPNDYGRNIASQKKSLARHVAEAFAGKGLLVSSPDRTIRDDQGRTLTDVDVAVISPAEHTMLLLEVKWPISPATAKETAKSDAEVESGFAQLQTARDAILRRQPSTLRQIFPSEDVDSWNLDEVHCVELVRGLYPSSSVSMKFPVVPVDPAIDYLRETPEKSLRAIARDLEEPPEDRLLSGLREYDVSLLMAGFDIRVPQWSWAAALAGRTPDQPVRPGRNARCPCGSGMKFKRCCQLATRSNSYTWRRIVSDIGRPV